MFDPLHKWLGIPAHEQPPNHYRLLGIALWEADPEVIDAAADKQLGFLHDLANGEHAGLAEDLSNQVSAARLRLLDTKKKQVYDATLRGQLEPDAVEPDAADMVAEGLTREASPLVPVVAASTESPLPIDLNITPMDAGRASQSRSFVKARAGFQKKYQDRTFWLRQFSTLCVLVVLAMVGIGIRQGKLVLDQSAMQSLGIPTVQSGNQPAANSNPVQATAKVDRVDASNANTSASPSIEPVGSDNTPRSSSSNDSTSFQSSPTRPTQNPSYSASNLSSDPSLSIGEQRRHSGSLADLMNSDSSSSTSGIVKSMLPSKNDLETKMSLVRELYSSRYRESKTTREKIELAQQMQRDGETTNDDPVGRFALWQVAKDIFQLHGEFESALRIIDSMQSHYSVFSGCELKADMIRSWVESVSGTEIVRAVDATLGVVNRCAEDEKYELGHSLIDFVQQKLGTRVISSKARELDAERVRIEVLADKFQKYRDGLETIKRTSTDPVANRDVGEYLCMIRGQWDEGLKHLSMGTDDAVRSAAVQEIAVATNVSRAIDAGDAWFAAAEAITDESTQSTLRRRAWSWYTRATREVTGLEQKKLELRLADLKSLLPELDNEQDSTSATSSPAKVLGYLTRTSSDSKSDAVNRRGNTFTLGMGARPDGRGEAEAGIEFKGVDKVRVTGAASHRTLIDVDVYSKSGFMVDYHTPGGYIKRVFLGAGLQAGCQFTDSPPWGKATKPDVVVDLGRSVSYEIDLSRWAPAGWDKQCWFTIVMHNAGFNRNLEASLSW